MSQCYCCGREQWCNWAGCERPATLLLHATRPCGHDRRVISSCEPCCERLVDARDGIAGRATNCPECDDLAPVEIHRGGRLDGGVT